MDISSLIVRMIFLLLPGAIGASLYWKMRGRAARKDWEDLLEVIVFSLLSYAIYASLIYFINWKFGSEVQFTAFEAFFSEKVSVRWQDVFASSLLAVFLAFLASYFYQNKLVNRIGKSLRVTSRFGDEDVWEFLHHSPSVSQQWVVVRDHKVDLYYSCWIQAFSDSGRERELLLREVNAYDNQTAEWRYKTDFLYLARERDDLTIEKWLETTVNDGNRASALLVSKEQTGVQVKTNLKQEN